MIVIYYIYIILHKFYITYYYINIKTKKNLYIISLKMIVLYYSLQKKSKFQKFENY